MIRKPSGNFFLLPNDIFAKKMKPREFIVYCYLKCCSDYKDHRCFPSLKTIAKNCNMSTVTASAAIKSLEEKGYINITHRYDENNYLSNLYTVLKI